MNPPDRICDYDAGLLEPISDLAPCGPNLRYDADYDRLRELRREDDAGLPSGVWQTEMKRADWVALETLAASILHNRSKDLMIAVWLGEAWLHRYGLIGLTRALTLLTDLCERFPQDLHPQPEGDDRSWRVAPFEWMVRRYEEVVLIRLPLFDVCHEEIGGFTLYDWQRWQLSPAAVSDAATGAEKQEWQHKRQRLHEAVHAASLSTWMRNRDDLASGLRELERLDRWCDGWLNELAPSFAPLRDVMHAYHRLIEEFIAMYPKPSDLPSETGQPASTADKTPEAESSADVAASTAASHFGSREEAYRQLLLIADYLSHVEPHSPVPYLVRRAVEWGNKPLAELLDELISSDAEARRVWKVLGILP